MRVEVTHLNPPLLFDLLSDLFKLSGMLLAPPANLLLLIRLKGSFTSSSRLVVQSSHATSFPSFKPVVDGFTTERKDFDQLTPVLALISKQNTVGVLTDCMMAALAIDPVEQALIFGRD